MKKKSTALYQPHNTSENLKILFRVSFIFLWYNPKQKENHPDWISPPAL